MLNIEPINKTAIFIEDYSSLGGVEKVTLNLISLFKKQELKIDALISLLKSNEKPFIKFESIVNVYVLDEKANSESEKKELLCRFLKESDIKNLIVQVQNLKVGEWVSGAGRSLGLNVICILHSSPFYFFKNIVPNSNNIQHFLRLCKRKFFWYPLNKGIFKRIISNTNYFVCISNKAAEELNSVKFLKSNKIITIYNPLFDLINDNVLHHEKENIVIFAGRLSFEKQVIKIVEVWRKLSPIFDQWSFLILGDGPEKDNIQNYIDEHQIRKVTMKGSVTDVEKYLEKSKICILFSLTEGLPTILIEAACLKNALIGNNGFGGTSDIIKDQFNGFLIKRNNTKELEEKLKLLMSDDSLIQEMANNNITQLQLFDNHLIINKWREILK